MSELFNNKISLRKPGRKSTHHICVPSERDTRAAGRRRPGPVTSMPSLQEAYSQKFPISTLKKQKLLKLCQQMVILEELYGWFQSLPTSHRTKDRAPCPGVDSDDDDD
ncbi:hypothetical protein PoB_003896200 [Plakobranchus ocellatus]|uniref:Uncharacterized protein n=1 Tax=Plakobranchus ocellatus TaxID=259542 RepID=A0AAV4AYU5_9GAST|nr:hypothetical protein PoB_003896200 [Plakobranchus ocellatus]